MSVLSEITALLRGIGLAVETGAFSDKAPDEYVVVTPMAEVFGFHADNRPQAETQEARLSLYSKGSYTKRKNEIVKALLNADFIITDRRYIGYDEDTKYHHYAIDMAKTYELED